MVSVKGVVEVEFATADDAAKARAVLDSEALERGRSRVAADAKGRTLVISIEAGDVAAFRAALNTALRLASVAQSGLEGVDGNG